MRTIRERELFGDRVTQERIKRDPDIRVGEEEFDIPLAGVKIRDRVPRFQQRLEILIVQGQVRINR